MQDEFKTQGFETYPTKSVIPVARHFFLIVDYKSHRICFNCLENFDLAKASNPIACGGFDLVL
jgi:hypothetical protein